MIEALSSTGYVLPGIVIALSLVFFTVRFMNFLYQRLPVLVFENDIGEEARIAFNTVRRLYAPESTSHAEMLDGDAEDVATRILDIVRERAIVKELS